MHRQEIAGVIFLAYQSEFFVQRADPFGRQAIGVPPLGFAAHKMFQPILRRPPAGHRLIGIFIFQLAQVKCDLVQEACRLGNRLRRARK